MARIFYEVFEKPNPNRMDLESEDVPDVDTDKDDWHRDLTETLFKDMIVRKLVKTGTTYEFYYYEKPRAIRGDDQRLQFQAVRRTPGDGTLLIGSNT